jgi:hypothetical protein
MRVQKLWRKLISFDLVQGIVFLGVAEGKIFSRNVIYIVYSYESYSQK